MMKKGIRNATEELAKKFKKRAEAPMEKRQLLKRPRFSIGWLFLICHQMKAENSSTEAVKLMMIGGELQPNL